MTPYREASPNAAPAKSLIVRPGCIRNPRDLTDYHRSTLHAADAPHPPRARQRQPHRQWAKSANPQRPWTAGAWPWTRAF